jgi:hypothetical protein
MKKMMMLLVAIVGLVSLSCEKTGGSENSENISTPRTNSVLDELVGRWAITSISGSTVYNIPAGTTYNTNEAFLGYQINKDGTTREDGYIATYQYGVSTWAKWTAYGSVELADGGLTLHRARGSYTSSRNSSPKEYGAAEVYPNKSFSYVDYTIDIDDKGRKVLVLIDDQGDSHTYVKQ